MSDGDGTNGEPGDGATARERRRGDAGGIGSSEELRAELREKYGAAAGLPDGEAGEPDARGDDGRDGRGCCSSGSDGGDPVTSGLYGEEERAALPDSALAASLGCGNPTALADLREGETVLDLGSGAGADVLLSARRVGPEGQVYGVDMTEEMLETARRNAREAGAENVEFRRGEIEDLPLPDASVDVIVSNCVVNLSADKPRVLREAFRVLRPGGRLAISDIVVRGTLPEELRRSAEAWAGCVAGVLDAGEYRELLAAAGFGDVEIETTRVYRPEETASLLADAGLDAEAAGEEIDGRLTAAFVRARRPEGGEARTRRPEGGDAAPGGSDPSEGGGSTRGAR